MKVRKITQIETNLHLIKPYGNSDISLSFDIAKTCEEKAWRLKNEGCLVVAIDEGQILKEANCKFFMARVLPGKN